MIEIRLRILIRVLITTVLLYFISGCLTAQQKFIGSARYGDVDKADSLISAGIDFEKCDVTGQTALHAAVLNGNHKVVELLLQKGCKPDIKNRYKKSPLLYCNGVHPNDMKCAELLIQAGADVNAEDPENGQSILFHSAKECNTKYLGFLIEKGAKVDKSDKGGMTPLMLASQCQCSKNVSKILQHTNNINAQDSAGRTALFYALKKDNDAVINLLLENSIDVQKTDTAGMTAIFMAAKVNSILYIEKLIQNGANITHCMDNGCNIYYGVWPDTLNSEITDEQEKCITFFLNNDIPLSNDVIDTLNYAKISFLAGNHFLNNGDPEKGRRCIHNAKDNFQAHSITIDTVKASIKKAIRQQKAENVARFFASAIATAASAGMGYSFASSIGSPVFVYRVYSPRFLSHMSLKEQLEWYTEYQIRINEWEEKCSEVLGERKKTEKDT